MSTHEQNLTGQVTELQAAGCDKIYSEKAPGDPVELARVIDQLTGGIAHDFDTGGRAFSPF